MVEIVCGKKDWGIRTGESDIKCKKNYGIKDCDWEGFYWDCN